MYVSARSPDPRQSLISSFSFAGWMELALKRCSAWNSSIAVSLFRSSSVKNQHKFSFPLQRFEGTESAANEGRLRGSLAPNSFGVVSLYAIAVKLFAQRNQTQIASDNPSKYTPVSTTWPSLVARSAIVGACESQD